ncbi:hypothetical protein [Pseudogulbenkiania ferrooxidans]|uniref:Uncharacterized protein n=1 Tax=Pseudogulbenkiania ferrooxidans 2002 TaxID=279714 RepID=B9Z103_9NEIS|nr:hypothetical protein [Pseudogulbenkiania ferrooxidans]EEG09098.1 hypothetical protein FuraDRAFT_1038 [Pseudogulbenkiania ferrooxidans 2002]
MSLCEADCRAVALCAYGNAFLADRLTLEDFHQHAAFADVAIQFRDQEGPLWTADYIQWLLFMRQRGISRLVLLNDERLLAYFPHIESPPSLGALLCLGGEETELWIRQKEPVLFTSISSHYPHCAHWAAPIDTYWQKPLSPPWTEINTTDWSELKTQCLEQVMNSPLEEVRRIWRSWQAAPCQPYIGPYTVSIEWQALPLTPYNPASECGHMLLQLLNRLDSWYQNFTHGKNDNSPFWTFSREEQNALGAWHDKIQYWQYRCLLALANQSDASNTPATTEWKNVTTLSQTPFDTTVMPPARKIFLHSTISFVRTLALLIGFGTALFYLFKNYWWSTLAVVVFILLANNRQQ